MDSLQKCSLCLFPGAGLWHEQASTSAARLWLHPADAHAAGAELISVHVLSRHVCPPIAF